MADTRGGTLGAQIAHVQYLGLCAHTKQVCSWSMDYLAHVLLWAQHVDLSWTTLTENEQKDVQLYSHHLLTSTRESNKLLTSPWFQQKLTLLVPGNCHLEILKSIISNADSPGEVRIMAIQQLLQDSSVAQVMDETMDAKDGREIWAIEQLMEQLIAHLEKAPKGGLLEIEQLKSEQEITKAMCNPWFPACTKLNAQMVSQIFAQNQPLLCNGIMLAALASHSESHLNVSQEGLQKHLPALDPRVMARLSTWEAYINTLLKLTLESQQNTLQVDELVEHWQQLYLANPLVAKQALRKSQENFHSLSGLDDSIKEFWSTLYNTLI